MAKRVLAAAIAGGVALTVWTFLVNAVFGFSNRVRMERVPDERAVHALLADQIREPGLYLVNPEVRPDVGFPPGEPVYSVQYAGFGHEAAGRMVLVELAFAFGSTLLVAGLLSMASERVLSRYGRRVLFVLLVGVVLAISGELARYGIGGHPLGAALALAANTCASWAVAALAIAWPMRGPERTP